MYIVLTYYYPQKKECCCGQTHAGNKPFCATCGTQIGHKTKGWNCNPQTHQERYNFGCRFCPCCGEVLFVPIHFVKVPTLPRRLVCLQ